jgi:hypothetical protein
MVLRFSITSLKPIKANSEICFLTARENNRKTKQFTKMDFEELGLNYDDFEIHYCGCIPKGVYIKNNIDYKSYNDIIFIDDLDKNIDNVK